MERNPDEYLKEVLRLENDMSTKAVMEALR